LYYDEVVLYNAMLEGFQYTQMFVLNDRTSSMGAYLRDLRDFFDFLLFLERDLRAIARATLPGTYLFLPALA